MLEDEIHKLADQEDWTPDALIALLTEFVTSQHLTCECLDFLESRTADAMIDEEG